MKLTYNTSELRQALSECFAVVNLRSPIETIKSVYIGDGVARATDTEMALSVNIGVTGEPMLLPVMAREIIAAVGGEDVVISIEEKQIVIECGLDTWNVPIADPKEFPKFKPIAADGVSVPATDLRRAVSRCVPLIDDTHGAMTSVLFDGTHIVGGSGSAICFTKVDAKLPRCMVPEKAAKVLLKLLEDGGDCLIAADNNSVKFEIGSRILQTRQVEGRYPAWERAAYKPAVFSTIKPSELLNGFRKSRMATKEDSRGIDVHLIGEKGQLILSGESESGSSSVVVPVESADNADRSERLDWRLVSSFLGTITDLQSTKFAYTGDEPGSQIQFITDDGSTCLVMPLWKGN